ncbi:MAG: iron-siderophore ABC transporter substrate-binding protein [Kaiparowitsia implicata GSE-PSE-MK54-09C]|jgi:iron complex transport system substrate-binding protein|nr:iron-siderophore ABC transporter substrate-binding protein [Kaiparowitsia implicata GSE-PSE-MK54-09C]
MKRSVRRILSLVLLGVLIFLLVPACTKRVPQTSTDSKSRQLATDCRVVKHARGEACIPLNPQRIVTLDFNSFAAALALDVKPVATWITTEIEADFDYFQSKSSGIEILRSPTGQPNLEKLVELSPDLIIVISHSAFEAVYAYLPSIAPTVILPWEEITGDWQQQTEELARTLEKSDIFSQKMDYYHQRISELKQHLNQKQEIKVSFMFIATGQLVIARENSFAGAILKDLGILNPLFEESGDLDLAISKEVLPEIDSDVIFIASLQQDDLAIIDALRKNPLWAQLKAEERDQVYLVDFSVWRGLNFFAAQKVLDDVSKYLVKTP